MSDERTFAMIDLAGFTALTETHGDEHAADAAELFANLARRSLDEGDELVKCIGDAVLLASLTPESGLTLVRRILDECRAVDGFLVTRTGLHHGPVVRRGDDYFGASVNLTARLAARAAGGQVLATGRVAEFANTVGITVVELGIANFKNIEQPVDIYELELEPALVESIDPVCHMRVNRATAAGHLRHHNGDYWFCSLECTQKFLATIQLDIDINTLKLPQ